MTEKCVQLTGVCWMDSAVLCCVCVFVCTERANRASVVLLSSAFYLQATCRRGERECGHLDGCSSCHMHQLPRNEVWKWKQMTATTQMHNTTQRKPIANILKVWRLRTWACFLLNIYLLCTLSRVQVYTVHTHTYTYTQTRTTSRRTCTLFSIYKPSRTHQILAYGVDLISLLANVHRR